MFEIDENFAIQKILSFIDRDFNQWILVVFLRHFQRLELSQIFEISD